MKITKQLAQTLLNNTNQTFDYDDNITTTDFDIDKILGRIVEQITYTMNKTKTKIEDIINSSEFPLSKKTWYNYKESNNKTPNRKRIKDINVSTLFGICQYTNVSADYYMCFNDIVRKEVSAEYLIKEFGLTSEALEVLSKMNLHTKNENFQYGKLSDTNFINTLITDFAPKFFSNIIDYYTAEDKLKVFENANMDKKKRLKKKYLTAEESLLIDEYKELQSDVDMQKYILVQNVYRFIDNLKITTGSSNNEDVGN